MAKNDAKSDTGRFAWLRKRFGKESKKTPEQIFEAQKAELTAEWDGNTALTSRLKTMNGLSGDRFNIVVSDASWSRDVEVDGNNKPPVMVRTININAQAEGETVRTPEMLTITCRRDADGDFEYQIAGGGLIRVDAVTTTGRAKAHNTVEEWLIAVQGNYNLTELAAAMQKQDAAFASPSAAPASFTAKP